MAADGVEDSATRVRSMTAEVEAAAAADKPDESAARVVPIAGDKLEVAVKPGPTAAKRKLIHLRSSDGVVCDIEEVVAMQSGTIRRMMLEEGRSDEVITLPNITSDILGKAICFCQKSVKSPGMEGHVGLGRMDQLTLSNLILAANYLDIKGLLDLTRQIMLEMKAPEFRPLTTMGTVAGGSQMLTLCANDGQSFKVESTAAMLSRTIKRMVEECQSDSVFIFLNISSKTLHKIIEFCQKHAIRADSSNEATTTGNKSFEDELKEFDTHFVNVKWDRLLDLLKAANYLDIKELLDLTCTIAVAWGQAGMGLGEAANYIDIKGLVDLTHQTMLEMKGPESSYTDSLSTMGDGGCFIFLTSDVQSFVVKSAVALLSRTLRRRVSGRNCDSSSMFVEISSRILHKVIEFCQKHVIRADSSNEATTTGNKSFEDELKEFDTHFVNVKWNRLLDLLKAANYLDIKELLDLTCQTVVARGLAAMGPEEPESDDDGDEEVRERVNVGAPLDEALRDAQQDEGLVIYERPTGYDNQGYDNDMDNDMLEDLYRMILGVRSSIMVAADSYQTQPTRSHLAMKFRMPFLKMLVRSQRELREAVEARGGRPLPLPDQVEAVLAPFNFDEEDFSECFSGASPSHLGPK